MLTGTCLCDYAGFSELFCQEDLTDGIVDFVCTGMI